MPESEPTRQAESKVIPPPRTDVKYPEVASIPPGQKSVIVIPKGPEVIPPKDPVGTEPIEELPAPSDE